MKFFFSPRRCCLKTLSYTFIQMVDLMQMRLIEHIQSEFVET